MIIRARKLPPTQSEPARMRATGENGASLTIPFPHSVEDPYEYVMMSLARAVYRDTFSVTYLDGQRWDVNDYNLTRS